ncbi:hypothetical protein CPB86DRAFT_399675 [Serendipita vermifera]|nr:hypothetical protein CPB86DRAFT_399675 [Serendipita vermifera]
MDQISSWGYYKPDSNPRFSSNMLSTPILLLNMFHLLCINVTILRTYFNYGDNLGLSLRYQLFVFFSIGTGQVSPLKSALRVIFGSPMGTYRRTHRRRNLNRTVVRSTGSSENSGCVHLLWPCHHLRSKTTRTLSHAEYPQGSANFWKVSHSQESSMHDPRTAAHLNCERPF